MQKESRRHRIGEYLAGNSGILQIAVLGLIWKMKEAIDQSSTPNDAYQIGVRFLKNWLAIGYEDDIGKVCRDMESEAHLDLWKKAVNEVQENNDDPYLRFQ